MSAVYSLETTSAAATEALGERIGAQLRGSELLVLAGELGAGKTCFVRGVARGLKMPAGVAVTSPTYVLQHVYKGGRLTLYHIDAYRMLGGAGEFEASGLSESLADAQGAVCLEWPERLADFKWPSDYITINIEHMAPTRRQITVGAVGAKYAALVAALPSPLGEGRRER